MSLNGNQNIMKFSIVVPVYNAENYLKSCLESLFSQNLLSEEYEIIAVNDGSQDGSVSILEELAVGHPNLKVVTTENRGVSKARNLGCSLACGKYLLFVDADDYLQKNSLQQLYTILEEHRLDILVTDYEYWNGKGELHHFSYMSKQKENSEQVMAGKDFMLNCLPQVVWCNVYRMDFWKQHSLQFLPIRHEDEEILPRIFYWADRVLFKPLSFYYYNSNPNSFMMTYDVRACHYLVQAMKSVDVFRKQYVKEEYVNDFFKNLISSRLLAAIVNGARSGLPQSELMAVIREMKEIGFSPLPKGKKGIHAFLYKYIPSCFVAYYRMKKKR